MFQPKAAFFLVVIGALAFASAGEHVLKGSHLKVKLNCQTCHGKETPAAAPAKDQACIDCHGDYPAMVETTKHLPKNPHAVEKKDTLCFSCHKQH